MLAGPIRRGSMNPGCSRHMKRLSSNAHIHSTFTKVDESAPQLTQLSTLQSEWYRAPQDGHPTIQDKIGCLQEKQGVVFSDGLFSVSAELLGAVRLDLGADFRLVITSNVKPARIIIKIIEKLHKITLEFDELSSVTSLPSLVMFQSN